MAERRLKSELLEENKELKKRLARLNCLEASVWQKIYREMLKTSLLAFSIVVYSIAWLWFGCFNEALYPLVSCFTGFILICIASLMSIGAMNKNCLNGILCTFVLSLIFGLIASAVGSSTLPGLVHC